MFYNHFDIRELFSNCADSEIIDCVRNGHINNLLVLLQVLDSLRDYIDYPILINSSFRSEEHNKDVGGVPTSQHLYGSAIDFCVPKVPFQTLEFYVREFFQKSALERFIGQVIFYRKRKFIHIGLRTPSHPNLIYLYYEKRTD